MNKKEKECAYNYFIKRYQESSNDNKATKPLSPTVTHNGHVSYAIKILHHMETKNQKKGYSIQQ